MSVRLLSYKFVPPGFEIVIGEKEICPGSKGGVWNLWWNIQLSDDPEAWDEEVRAINRLQRKLEEVPEDLRLIRSQMAEFCRVSPLFPESVDVLCEEISTGRLAMPYKLGCEGRSLMERLGYHDSRSMKEQRTHSLKEYTRSLKSWLSGKRPQNSLDAKISGFLGEVTEPREVFVKDILSRLGSGESSFPVIKDMCEAECRKMMGDSYDTRARPLHCFDCPGSRLDEDDLPGCPCSHGTLIDVGILCTRINEDWTAVLREYRRFAEEYILSYAFALNSWLVGSTAVPVTPLTPCRYVTEEIAEEIPVKVNVSLGDKDDHKVWLVACLLKTLKSNQRWHKRKELIDDFPEATSWFREIL